MADSAILTVRMPRDLLKRLDKLAEATERNRSYVAVKALEQYVASEEWQVRHIREGIRQMDAGRGVPHEKVKPWLEGLAKGRRRTPPR